MHEGRDERMVHLSLQLLQAVAPLRDAAAAALLHAALQRLQLQPPQSQGSVAKGCSASH